MAFTPDAVVGTAHALNGRRHILTRGSEDHIFLAPSTLGGWF